MSETVLERLTKAYLTYTPQGDAQLLAKAYEFSKHAHAAQRRANQDPYFTHCVAVAETLIEYRLDLATICAGLLHDVIEDTHVTYDEIKHEFTVEVADLVQGVTKLDRLRFSDTSSFQAENWRKMLYATAKDVRVILIKISDRLHNIKTIRHLESTTQQRIAQETIHLYAPMAEQLGMYALKSDLEDHAFAVLNPSTYAQIGAELERGLAARRQYLDEITHALEERLTALNVPMRFMSRPKNIYAIYLKMQRQNKTLPEIEDAMALRIVTDTVANCYAILGEVHSQLKPVPDSFTDYIAHPKPNLYQSLHTTVYGPDNKIVEVQVRTEEMHRRAEHGIAAHWRYKMGGARRSGDKELETRLDWLRECLEWLQDLKNPEEFMESLKTELKTYQIFVFTPKKDVKALPENSTPIDFAFAVHTDIGCRCTGAKVNGKMVKLDYRLKSGDTCEIQTRKNAKPNKEWLEFVKSARARSRIRRSLKNGKHA
ncbi:MAG: RelA/SpoT family protein [Elusimicrobiota bacterium]